VTVAAESSALLVVFLSLNLYLSATWSSFLIILFCAYAYILHSWIDFEHDCPTAQLARQSRDRPSRYGSSRGRCRTASSLFMSTFLEFCLLRPSSNCREL